MYPHFFDGAKKRWYPPKKRFPTPAVCSRKRCPLHKGTKTLHRKNGGSDSRPPSFRPTAVFILHLLPGYFRLFFDGMGLVCHCEPSEKAWQSVFLFTDIITISVGADIIRPFKKTVVCGGGIPPVLTKGQNHPFTRGVITSAEGGRIIHGQLLFRRGKGSWRQV